MRYVSEAIYQVTAWLEPEVADNMAKEFDLDDYNHVTINGIDKIEVVFRTADIDERDCVCDWLETNQ